MSDLSVPLATAQLARFIRDNTLREVACDPPTVGTYTTTVAGEDGLRRQAQIVEEILDRVLPDWRDRTQEFPFQPTGFQGLRAACLRAQALLERREELRRNLGDDAPEISASNLRAWIWSGAESLWRSGHYRSAVEDGAKKVNAETQNKVGRRDVSETKLFQEVFSEKTAEPGKARLRRMTPDGSDTYRSVQRSAMAMAEGVFAGIRNSLSHEADQELDEQVALESLAALSVLARWVDDSTVERAGNPS